jgi:hypothetical protein
MSHEILTQCALFCIAVMAKKESAFRDTCLWVVALLLISFHLCIALIICWLVGKRCMSQAVCNSQLCEHAKVAAVVYHTIVYIAAWDVDLCQPTCKALAL